MFLLQTRYIEPMEIERGSSDKDPLHTLKKSPESMNIDKSVTKTKVSFDENKTYQVIDTKDSQSGDSPDFKLKQMGVDKVISEVDNTEMKENEPVGTKTEVAFYTETLIKDFWDKPKMKWIHPRTGKYLNVQEGIDSGVISPDIIQVKQINGKTISLQKAINAGQVNVQTGQTIDLVDGKNIEFDVAFENGLLTVDDNQPVERCDMYVELGPGLVELIAKGEISRETKLLDAKLKHSLSIPQSIDLFIFDTEHGKVKNTASGKWLSWDEAKQVGLVNKTSCQLSEDQPVTASESEPHKHISFDTEDVRKSNLVLEHPKSKILEWKKGVLVTEKPKSLPTKSETGIATVMLDEAIKQGLYSPVSNTFKNPVDGLKYSFENALRKGLINKESLLRDPVSRDILTLSEAVEKRVVDPESGKMLDSSGQPIALNYAYNLGLIMRSQSPLKLSISEILDEGLYDEESGTFLDPDRNEEISFTESLTTGLLDPDLIRVKDIATGEILKLEAAIEKALVNVETGTFFDKSTGKHIQVSDALEKGLIIDTTNQPKMSLQNAFEENMIDVDTCLFFDPVDGSRQTLKAAVESCLLDKDSVLVRDPQTLTVLTLESAISEGIVHPQTGHYILGTEELTFYEAFEKGLIVCNATHGIIPCSLIEAIRFSLFDPVTKKFTDPRTGQNLTLEEAISYGLIDTNNTMIKDTQTGRFLSLSNAAYLGIINFKSANILDIREDTPLELTEAKEKGILRRSASDECISLVTAIGKGHVDKDGKVYDRLSGKDLFLSDAIMTKVIDSTPTLVKDTSRNVYVPLVEALESGIIDESRGHVLDIVGTKILTYHEAVEAGLIVEIPSTGLTLAEAVNDGLFDEETGLLLDLRTGKRVTMEEGLEQKLIDSSKPQVVVLGHGLLSLKVAFEMGVIDSKTGSFIDNGKEIPLTEAVDRDLIVKLGSRRPHKPVSDSDLKNMETLLQHKEVLVRDPMSRSFIGLELAVDKGIVDLPTQTFCDLQHNIVLSLKEAAKTGLVVNARHPDVGLANLVRNDMFDNVTCTFFDPRSGNRVTLEEGVKQGLIDPFQTRVKNIETDTYVSLQQALKIGIISGKTGTVFDKKQKKSYHLDFSVHENIVIDFKKSSFTVDEGIKYGLMTHDGLMVEDLESGEFITFKEAIDRGTVKIQNAVLECPAEGVYMTLAEGIEDQTVDEMSAMVKLPSGRRLSLSQAVAQHMIVEKESTAFSETYHEIDEPEIEDVKERLKKEIGRKRSMELDLPAMDKKVKREGKSPILSPVSSMSQSGLISNWIDTATYGRSDSVSSPIRFDEALKFGFLDVESGEFRDNITNEIMPIEHAVETGKLSIKGVHFYDEKTHFSIPLKEAIKKKLVVSKHDTGSPSGLTFKEAINQSLLIMQIRRVDFLDDQLSVKSETFTEPAGRSKALDWLSSESKALSSSLDSLIQKVQKDQSGYRIATLFEAVQKDLIDDNEGTIHDSFTQKNLTLEDALSCGLINPEAKEVLDPTTNEQITLEKAIQFGFIDPYCGTFKHPSTGEVLTLRHACEKGFIRQLKDTVESKSSVEIYVEEILANDGANGKNKLQEAFASGVLTKSKTQVIDPDTVQPITLRRAGSLGMIDSKTGEFKNPQTGEQISLAEAVQKGFILSPKGLSLYSAVNQGLYSDESGKFTDPNSGKVCTLSEMLEIDVIAEGCMEVRDVAQNGELIRLREAVRKGVIDSVDGKYVNLDDGKKYTLTEAIALGLIISNIPREGLRESSSSVAAVSAHQGKADWPARIENDYLKTGHELTENDKSQPVTKETVSLSSIETESSGYETYKSQPLHPQEPQTFVIDFEKYKLNPNYLEGKSQSVETTKPCKEPEQNEQKDADKVTKFESIIKADFDKRLSFDSGKTQIDGQNVLKSCEIIPMSKEKLSSDFNISSFINTESDIMALDAQNASNKDKISRTGFAGNEKAGPSLNLDITENMQIDMLASVTKFQPPNTEAVSPDILSKDKILPNLNIDSVVKPLQDNFNLSAVNHEPDADSLNQESPDLAKSMISDKSMILSFTLLETPTDEVGFSKEEGKGSVSPRTPKSPIYLHDNNQLPGQGQGYSFQGEIQKQMLSPVKNKVFTFKTGPPLSLSEERKVFGLSYKHHVELGILMFD